MSFEVNWEAIDDFSDGIGVLDGASGKAADYTVNLVFKAGPGDLFGLARSQLSDDRGTVEGAALYLQTIARASAKEIHRAAGYYHRTDHDVQVLQDRNYPR